MIKVLHLDIERTPALGAIWDIWGINVGIDQIIKDSEVLCWAASWEGKDKVEFSSSWQHGRLEMLKKVHALLSEADAVVTYNGDKFDIKVLQMEFAKFGLGQPSPYKSIDLLKTVKRRFKMTSYKLDYVLRYFALGQKLPNPGMVLWLDCMNGKAAARKLMKQYNIQDVTEMKKLFAFLKGWGIVGMPNLSAYTREECCPECGSKHYQKRGTRVVNVYRYPRYHCQDCGNWFRGNKAYDEDRPMLMVP